ncbi:MAG: SAM-dependent methyltransferase [Candidatus Sericytochromatia bacterium]|nr:SAM-dependent methyltransferase [Candidatus Tanganyikabacteria bacterium]
MTAAEAHIRARLAEGGRLTFAEFMALALYGPGGYYCTDRSRIGPAGDFYTSPTVHPAFGALLAGQAREIWQRAGRPHAFDILELGGGRGTLAADLLYALREGDPACFAAVRYTVSDLAPPPDVPPAVAHKIAFRPGDAGLPDVVTGLVLANEFLDALPVHRVQKLQGKLQELYVEIAGDRLCESPGPPSKPDLELQVAPWFGDLPEGGTAEVSLAMVAFMKRLGAALRGGVALFIDYGGWRSDLLRRPAGTLRAYWRHRIQPGPFEAIGEADITCHVDFSSLRNQAAALGFEVLGEISQGAFLQNLGMAELRRALAAAPLDPPALAANLAALEDLVAPAGLGAFRVMALGAATAGLRLSGIEGGPLPPLCAPAATRRHMALWGGNLPGDAWREVEPPGWSDLLVGGVEDLD